MLNVDQVSGFARIALQILGTISTMLGFMTAEEAATMTTNVLAAVGPVLIAIGGFWTWWSNRKAAKIKSVSAMPEVDSKKLEAAISPSAPDLKVAAATSATEQSK